MKIMKFGGSSVGTPERIESVIRIILRAVKKHPVAVVVSAFQGVTDLLIEAANLAAARNHNYSRLLEQLKRQHRNAVLILANKESVRSNVELRLQELEEVLHGVYLVKELTPRTLDFIMSFGERLSACIIAEAIRGRRHRAEFLDARCILKTDQHFGSARVDIETSYPAIRKYFRQHPDLQIITGFIGSSHQDETTTLGRGGSDYSASLFGAALKVKEIEIWTDVDGVMTADPRKVKKAFPISSMTYEEAMEMSHFGAKIIHPPTMQPALRLAIPIRIKNTFHPEFPGTLISKTSEPGPFPVKGISSIRDVALCRIQGSGMVGVAGVASRLFGALAKQRISVILITQASSEHSICFAVEPKFAEAARKAIEKEFALEIKVEEIDPVYVEHGHSIIAVVGERMRSTAGIAGKLFQALGERRINVVAIAQGSSELNISIVVQSEEEAKALAAVHDTFFA